MVELIKENSSLPENFSAPMDFEKFNDQENGDWKFLVYDKLHVANTLFLKVGLDTVGLKNKDNGIPN